MAIIELIFIIFKTIVLSTIYASIILALIYLLSTTTENNWIRRTMNQKMRFWLLTHFIISVGLFFFSFSYSQDTGIGDNSRIPIGFGQTIQNEDFQWTYFYPDLSKTDSNKDELVITNYIIYDNKICAELSHENSINSRFEFIVYDLATKHLIKFENEKEYITYADKNKLPYKNVFYNFEKHFHEYLENRAFWETWLIP